MQATDFISKMIDFIHQVGIATEFTTLEEKTFLPGLQIHQGKLYIDVEKLSYPGDLLHEAGHLAVVPTEKRKTAGAADFGDGGEEIAAILWSYAAAKAIDLPLEVLFHSDGYKGSADWLQESFEQGNYIGLPMLEWMGLAASEQKAQALGVAPFPNMIKWLRE